MKWQWRQLVGPGNQEEVVVRAEPDIQPSLALSTLFRQLKKERKYHILELGPAVGQNIEFLSRFSCRIRVEDLYNTLASFDYLSCKDKVDYEAIFQYLLPYDKTTRFDIILAWDVFNYLERAEFTYFMRHLSRFCHSGTVLFALVATAKHMSDRPGSFRIVDENNVQYSNDCSVLRACPRYHDVDLKQILSSFRVYNSYLLRNGMKEYLFVGN